MKKHVLATLALMAMATVASAQTASTPAPVAKDPTATPRLDKRMANQEKRIEQGVASGQLTTKEATRMQARETKLATDVAAAKSDGKVIGAERKALEKEANRDSKAIYRQKHDKQKAAK